MRRSAAIVLCLAALPALGGSAEPELRRVLFIGNSLTAWNDLPAIVAALAEYSGKARLEWQAVLAGGASLEDHWNDGRARRAIAGGRWDVVVLQQGPSALPESRTNLLLSASRFAAEIRKAGARPALLMVWPSAGRAGDFDRVCESYRLAAREVDGLLFPAGEAWRAAWRRDHALALYSPDGLHPTPAGSYLAALVVYAGLFGRSPVGLPAHLAAGTGAAAAIDLTAEQAALLQAAAAEAEQRFARP